MGGGPGLAPGAFSPATPRRVGKAEAALGFRLPDDLRASLLRHGGRGPVGRAGCYQSWPSRRSPRPGADRCRTS
ncbi:SMI1/KNR4 family protein [Streptosporangium canum]|uniref:SMI1/KNR4 family protein n=1 Tax=Streptosporangium canum TaxID=324952 RepID=UPI0033BAB7B0